MKRGSLSYSSRYGAWRASLGLQTDHYDLKVSGRYWDSIKVDVNSVQFEVINTDSKAEYIHKMFTDGTLGLTPRNKKEKYVPEHFMPALIERIERKLGI